MRQIHKVKTETGFTTSRRKRGISEMQQRWHLRSSKLAVAAVALCLLPQTLFAHKQKDLEPQDRAQAQQWVEQGLDHFKNVKVSDQYITYSDSQNTYGIALPRI